MAGYQDEDMDLVAAIDFGTTYSAYAYAFYPESKAEIDPHDVKVNKDWGAEMRVQMPKTPTIVFLIDGKFSDFGHSAERKYNDYCWCAAESNSGKYNLIKNFKMMLYHEKNLSRTTEITSLSGNKFLALTIFAMVLGYLKKHLQEAVLKESGRFIKESKIKWVITIPAIWNDNAKQFMREAALEACLISTQDSKKLVFALETEAASVICRGLQINHFQGMPEETTEQTFPFGTKYMIVDAGGGTVDITTHEILQDGNIKEITYASGGNWGGNELNRKFEELLNEVLGTQFISQYKYECPLEWLDILNEFEKKKREVFVGTSSMKISLSCDIDDYFFTYCKSDIGDVIKKSSSLGVDYSQLCEISLNKDAIERIFNIDNVINHIKEKMNDKNLEGIKYILLVGGYGRSEILFQQLKHEFSGQITVIRPYMTELCIVKGAVLFGKNPSIITARVARKTYGFGINGEFIEGVHEQCSKFETDDGRILCRDQFITMVKKNEMVELNSIRTFIVKLTNRSQTSAEFDFYASEKTDIVYKDEEGIKKVAELTVDNLPVAPKYGTTDDRTIKVSVLFGHPEIVVELEDQTKNPKSEQLPNLYMDFLCK